MTEQDEGFAKWYDEKIKKKKKKKKKIINNHFNLMINWLIYSIYDFYLTFELILLKNKIK